VINALKLGLELLQTGSLGGDGRGGELRREDEGENEGAEEKGEGCDSSSIVHCIASFRARRVGDNALDEVSPEREPRGSASPSEGDEVHRIQVRDPITTPRH
jgi:hypothetical protein